MQLSLVCASCVAGELFELEKIFMIQDSGGCNGHLLTKRERC